MYQALTSRLPERNIPFFKYLQRRHFLNSTKAITQWHRDHTPLEALCSSTEPQRHLISVVYSRLFSGCDPKANKLSQQWERRSLWIYPKNGSEYTTTSTRVPLTFQRKKMALKSTPNGTRRPTRFTNITHKSPHCVGDVILP